MDADGEVVWEVRPTTEDVFKEALQRARRLVDLSAKLAESPDDKVVAANHALLDAIGRSQREAPTLEDLDEHAKVEGVDAEILEAFAAWRVEKAVMAAIRRPDACYELFKDSPPAGLTGGLAIYFHMQAAKGALDASDKETARKAVEIAREMCGEDEQASQQFGPMLDELEKDIDAG